MLLAGIGLILVAIALCLSHALGYAIGAGLAVNAFLFGGLILTVVGALRSSDGSAHHWRHSHG